MKRRFLLNEKLLLVSEIPLTLPLKCCPMFKIAYRSQTKRNLVYKLMLGLSMKTLANSNLNPACSLWSVSAKAKAQVFKHIRVLNGDLDEATFLTSFPI